MKKTPCGKRSPVRAGVSIKTVANVLGRRGITASRWFKATAQQRLQALQLLATGADPAMISSATGLAVAAVRKFTAHNRPSLFRAVDTPEKAYWLGFLNADGAILGVNPGTLRLQVALARKDRNHLIKLQEFLGIEREIWDYEARTIGDVLRPYSRLICQERPIVMDLVRHGILPNKTGKEKPWADGPADLHAALLARHGRRRWIGAREVLQRDPGRVLRGRQRLHQTGRRMACGTQVNPIAGQEKP